MNFEILVQLVAILVPLSLVAVGGGYTVLPEIHRQVVETRGWLTDAEFAELFALAQAAPGPNLLVVSLIGWRVGGLAGALVALLAMIGPSSILAFSVAHAWGRLGRVPWRLVVQSGLAPVAVGLMLAGGAVLVGSADLTPAAFAVTLAAAAAILRGGIHPLLLMALAAVLALAGLI